MQVPEFIKPAYDYVRDLIRCPIYLLEDKYFPVLAILIIGLIYGGTQLYGKLFP